MKDLKIDLKNTNLNEEEILKYSKKVKIYIMNYIKKQMMKKNFRLA